MKDEALTKIAKGAKKDGDNNLAIILHVYLGSKKVGLDGLFAEYCQDFAKSGMDWIETQKRIEQIKNRNGRN